jgi:hypothetical protein
MRQYECMTTENEKIQDYSSFFRVGDSPAKVSHLIANNLLPNTANKDDKQEEEEEDRSRKARK